MSLCPQVSTLVFPFYNPTSHTPHTIIVLHSQFTYNTTHIHTEHRHIYICLTHTHSPHKHTEHIHTHIDTAHIQATHITMYAHTPRTPCVPDITPLIFPTPRDILCTLPQHAYPSRQSQAPIIHLFTLSASLCPCSPVAAITVFL